MKTKKILLGSLLVLATAMTAANLWADSNPPPQPMEQCKWHLDIDCYAIPNTAECVWHPPGGAFCNEADCILALEEWMENQNPPCNPN